LRTFLGVTQFLTFTIIRYIGADFLGAIGAVAYKYANGLSRCGAK